MGAKADRALGVRPTRPQPSSEAAIGLVANSGPPFILWVKHLGSPVEVLSIAFRERYT